MQHRRSSLSGVALLVTVLVWAVPAAASPTVKHTTVINVIAGKPTPFAFTLSSKTVKTGTVTFKVANKGVGLPHTFKVCSSNKGGKANACAGKVTPTIKPGKSATLTVTFTRKGTYEYLCTIPGHAAAGMKGDLKVT